MSNENTASKGVGSTAGSALNCRERINDYLSCGGLFNPELMEHEKVRALLLDCREEIMELQLARDRYHMDRDIWKWRAEKAEAAWLCAENEAKNILAAGHAASARGGRVRPVATKVAKGSARRNVNQPALS